MLGGAILDRAASPRVIVPMYLAAPLGILLLERGDGTLMLVAAGFLLAIGLGIQFSALPYVLGRYFGLRHFATIMGAGYSAVFFMQGAVPILLDHVFDVTRSYAPALSTISGCLVVGGGLLFFLPPYRYGQTSVEAVALHA
jgi:hypothetical protein